jgi:lipopolysaccharide transport system ATP-binding protein
MTDIAISCEALSKQYRIGERESYKALRDVITDAAAGPFRRVRSALGRNGATNGQPSPVGRPSAETQNSDRFWALKDVSFEIKPGEVVGIIGRNGAGKSTLLKILSRITKPTAGHAKIHGRVGSLLEVGTGFHPELTGRENIYLNAAILGMRKAEVERQFDEIVAFAEVEKFIDTPVKRYSSGMYVRLAFAVAAHLEPEILIIDEVLAVGDAAFQKKCLGKMGEVAHGGRTVLFVSHNMSAIRTLCDRTLVLDGGLVVYAGATASAVAIYSADSKFASESEWVRSESGPSAPLLFENIKLVLVGEQPNLKLQCVVRLKCIEACARSFLAVDICDQTATPIMQALPDTHPFLEGRLGTYQVALEVHLPPLIPGHYTVNFWVGPHYSTTLDYVKQRVGFEVTASPSVNRSFPHSSDHGSIVPTCTYEYAALNQLSE